MVSPQDVPHHGRGIGELGGNKVFVAMCPGVTCGAFVGMGSLASLPA